MQRTPALIAFIAVFCLAPAPRDPAAIELDRLKVAGASEKDIDRATRAYETHTAATVKTEDQTWRELNAALIGARKDVLTKRLDFVKTSQTRLGGKGVVFANQDLADWNAGKNTMYVLEDRRWAAATKAVYKAADDADEKSHVTFQTKTGAATVRYQTLSDADENKTPKTAQQLTNCKEDMTPAAYYVWTERKGKPTSQKREYDIIRENETIFLEEQ